MVDLAKENKKKDQVFVGIFAVDGRKFKILYKDLGKITEDEFDKYVDARNHLPELAYQ
jgi:cysteine synthase B